jgi:hypothetical protein
LYKRLDEELKRKEQKLKVIKEKKEIEKRMRNQALGILEEEDIIKMKKEKDAMLKDKFSLESFEMKYERQIKLL